MPRGRPRKTATETQEPQTPATHEFDYRRDLPEGFGIVQVASNAYLPVQRIESKEYPDNFVFVAMSRYPQPSRAGVSTFIWLQLTKMLAEKQGIGVASTKHYFDVMDIEIVDDEDDEE